MSATGIHNVTSNNERMALRYVTEARWWEGINRLPIARYRPRAPPWWPIDAGMSIEPLPLGNRK